jgi:hypothetical protein
MIREYAGVGSRETPQPTLELMEAIAKLLGKNGYILRSGGARGADDAFKNGSLKHKLYLPSETHRGLTGINCLTLPKWAVAEQLAEEYVKGWSYMDGFAKKLLTRNVFIMLGENLNSPVEFAVYWAKISPRGEIAGGTGMGIRLAKDNDILTFNLNDTEEQKSFFQYLESK